MVRRKAFELHVYDRLGSVAAARALNADLARFATTVTPRQLTSLVAVFAAPSAPTEARYSALLWRQLQHMHDLDHGAHPWDPRVSADPDAPDFSFSVAGTAYFVVGMHAASSRWARRFAWPTLVFNPHEQFTSLRARGGYERMRDVIRTRDMDLQGSVNPSLRDHGSMSEARQYAGDQVGDEWRCPLHVHGAP